MDRIALVSLAAGGAVFLLFSALYLLSGWPTAWFGVVAGAAVAGGLFIGLRFARRTVDVGASARAVFVLLGLLMGAVGVLGLVRPSAYQPSWVAWVAVGCGVYYLASASVPVLWSRRS